jgi:SAM-dependent methyltransferase
MESESTYWAVGVALEKISLNNKSLKILEIGSGLGYLTYALKKSGYDILGLDISEKAVSEAINMFGDHYVCEDIFNYSKTHSNIYDIVILTEVIEHIENPLVFINEILKLIKPGGSIILTTPNKSLFPSTVHWKTELPPVHYWWLSEDSILNICLKLNSTCSFINFKEYYNNNYKSFNILKYKKNVFEDSILNIDGVLKLAHNTELSKHRSWFHNLILFMFIKNIFRYLRDLLNPNFVRCGVRGDVLCAIVNKNINK